MASEKNKQLKTLIKEKKIKYVDYKFIDVPGTWQHKTHPIAELTDDIFTEGTGFDGSSIRGFQGIEESDMLLIPDAESAFVDPFIREPTISLTCDVVEPDGFKPYERDPRFIAKKAEKYLISTGIADMSYFGPELEFFIFDDVQFDVLTPYKGTGYSINSCEGIWNSNDNCCQNLGHRPRFKEGYFPVPPTDTQVDIRNEMVGTMMDMGMRIEVHHHEVSTAGQAEIGLRFNSLTKVSDHVLMYKYVVKNVAAAQWQDSDVHAEALIRRQRQRHAHSPEPLEERQAIILRQGRLRHALKDRFILHRRPADARPFAVSVMQPEHQLVQETCAGIRSTGEPGVLQQEQERGSAHTHVLGRPQDQAYRVQAT